MTGEEELGNDNTPADFSTLPVSSQKASKAKGKRVRDTSNSGKREVVVKARKLSAKALAYSSAKAKGAAKVKEAASLAKKRKEDAREQSKVLNKNGTVARTRSLPPENTDSLDLEELDTTELQKELDETKKSLDDSLVKLKVREVEIPLSFTFLISKCVLYSILEF